LPRLAPGLIAGGSIGGLVLAIIGIEGWDGALDLSPKMGAFADSTMVAFAIFLAMAATLTYVASRKDEV